MKYCKELREIFIEARRRDQQSFGPTPDVANWEYRRYLAIMSCWFASSDEADDIECDPPEAQPHQLTM